MSWIQKKNNSSKTPGSGIVVYNIPPSQPFGYAWGRGRWQLGELVTSKHHSGLYRIHEMTIGNTGPTTIRAREVFTDEGIEGQEADFNRWEKADTTVKSSDTRRYNLRICRSEYSTITLYKPHFVMVSKGPLVPWSEDPFSLGTKRCIHCNNLFVVGIPEPSSTCIECLELGYF